VKPRRLLAIGATALAGILVAPAALAVPSEDEIDAVRGEAEDTRALVSEIEVDLARTSAEYDAAMERVQVAAEKYNSAQEALNEAEAEAKDAQDELTEALADLDEARALVAGIATSAYRNGGNFSQLSLFLESDGISEAISSANTYSILGTHADGAEQQLDAATLAADAAKERADEAVADQQTAVEALNSAHAQTTLEAEAAQEAMDATSAERDALLGRLADLRDTTVEMERERQDHLDEQRRERENRAAQAEVERAEQQQESEQDSPASSSSPSSSPSSTPSSESSSPAASPSSSPSATSTPSPSRTSSPSPSPSRTSSPSPTQTASPTPTPTRTPTPSPTTEAPKPKPDPKPKPPASSGAGAKALAWAKTQIGKPYVWGSAGPNSYDCSGLTMAAFRQAGVSLPRNSGAQYNVGTKVSVNNMKPGDLFFYSNNGSPSGIYHVAIYAGNGMRLHAPSPGKSVELVPMWWANVLPNAVRL